MAFSTRNVQSLEARVKSLESELLDAKRQLAESQRRGNTYSSSIASNENTEGAEDVQNTSSGTGRDWPLDSEEYARYGRQMIMPEIGLGVLPGQLKLRGASVMIIGLGGLGCPAAIYLAGAGVGTIGLVDGDVVELSNLHRQILHTTSRISHLKAESAVEGLRQLNPNINYVVHPIHLSSTNALDIFKNYDLVLDCTDHPSSRYLVSDAAVLSGIPLVSASALKTEGQLMVLNDPPSSQQRDGGGPCYRCIFPKPPPIESIVSCGEGGVLGPVVGVMGVLMALEAIKIITRRLHDGDKDQQQGNEPAEDVQATLLLFSAYSNPPFRQVRLRRKRSGCFACSLTELKPENLGKYDYTALCGVTSPLNILNPNERMGAKALEAILLKPDKGYQILDVREKTQFELCHLKDSINVPYSAIENIAIENITSNSANSTASSDQLKTSNPLLTLEDDPSSKPICIICRYGNDSQLAVRKLKALGYGHDGRRWIGDVQGGLRAWKTEVDPNWPEY